MCSLCCCQIRLWLVRSMFQPYSYNKFDSKFISNVKPACRPVLNCFRVPNPPLYLLLIYSTNCTSCLISTVNLDLSSHYIDPDLLSFCLESSWTLCFTFACPNTGAPAVPQHSTTIMLVLLYIHQTVFSGAAAHWQPVDVSHVGLRAAGGRRTLSASPWWNSWSSLAVTIGVYGV